MQDFLASSQPVSVAVDIMRRDNFCLSENLDSTEKRPTNQH